MKKIGILLAACVISILLMQFVWYIPTTQKAEAVISSEKINLALRRTGHLLLQQAGDSTSKIPPIKQIKKNVWQLRLAQHFQYDSLPVFLQNSLALHNIKSNYDVAILNCYDGTLVLGYNYWDIATNQKAPCGGREMDVMCYDIQFSLLPEMKKEKNASAIPWILSILLAGALYFLGKSYIDTEKKEPEMMEQTEPSPKNSPAKEGLSFGNSCLDVANQILTCGEITHKLTYREAKLLHLFVQQANQVLERNFILENVWADEGVMVGRSVDMFVSRLRKMLRDDPNVQLVAVHGVGYKLEVT